MAELSARSKWMLQQYIKQEIGAEVKRQVESGAIPSSFGDVGLTSLEAVSDGSEQQQEQEVDRKAHIDYLKGGRIEDKERDADRARAINILKGGK
jgi:hypothetical protein